MAWTMLRGLLVVGTAMVAGCAGGEKTDQGGGGSCTPGQSQACACPNGAMGAQSCALDGSSFLACECSEPSGASQTGSGEDTAGDADVGGSDSASEGSGDPGGDTTGGPVCGDGVEDPGECDEADPAFCPDDCPPAAGSTSGDPCAGVPILAGSVAAVPSLWEHMGLVGYPAGNSMCQGIGGDHACDYEEILAADAAGELDGMAVGTTAWVHRTTVAMVNGAASNPGLGGRCVDWTYSTNHLSDGEFVEFTAAGPVFHLDNDTAYDGETSVHTQQDLPQCGNQTRAILCCAAACM